MPTSTRLKGVYYVLDAYGLIRPNDTSHKLLDVSKATNFKWTYKTELKEDVRLAYKDFLDNPMKAERYLESSRVSKFRRYWVSFHCQSQFEAHQFVYSDGFFYESTKYNPHSVSTVQVRYQTAIPHKYL